MADRPRGKDNHIERRKVNISIIYNPQVDMAGVLSGAGWSGDGEGDPKTEPGGESESRPVNGITHRLPI